MTAKVGDLLFFEMAHDRTTYTIHTHTQAHRH